MMHKDGRFSNLAVVAMFSYGMWSFAAENAALDTCTISAQEKCGAPTFQWDDDFKVVDIASSADGAVQKANFFASRAVQPQPLLVHLHTWSNDYSKPDLRAGMARDSSWNYIHPNFRGRNNTPKSCCSDLAIQDIDDAVEYASQESNVDESRIYIAGYSGGGLATLCAFMRSQYRIKSFS